MQQSAMSTVAVADNRIMRSSFVMHGELVRKSLHMLIALVPSIATAIGVLPTLALLSIGVLFYGSAEYLRLHGRSVVFVTNVTIIASRPRDRGGFVLGPVTLATGAMLALMLYPAPAATVAIYALAFGDGFASLVGRAFGRTVVLAGKTVAGSLACFVAVFFATLAVTGNPMTALYIATAATLLEALPTNDIDNILLPTGVGFLAAALM